MASRDTMKARFYEGELWKHELEQVVMSMLEKYDVTLVEDPGRLIQWPEPGAGGGRHAGTSE